MPFLPLPMIHLPNSRFCTFFAPPSRAVLGSAQGPPAGHPLPRSRFCACTPEQQRAPVSNQAGVRLSWLRLACRPSAAGVSGPGQRSNQASLHSSVVGVPPAVRHMQNHAHAQFARLETNLITGRALSRCALPRPPLPSLSRFPSCRVSCRVESLSLLSVSCFLCGSVPIHATPAVTPRPFDADAVAVAHLHHLLVLLFWLGFLFLRRID